MKKFGLGQRVLVRKCEHAAGIPGDVVELPGEVAGYVYRVRSDGSAWVRLDLRTTQPVFPFPSADHRGRDVKTYPSWCRADRWHFARRDSTSPKDTP